MTLHADARPEAALPGAVTPSRGRLLLISTHFPPARTAGSLRWQKMAAYFLERGWELDVVTLDTADLTDVDPGRLKELPVGTRIFPVRLRTLALDRFVDGAWMLAARLRARLAAPAAESPAVEARAAGADGSIDRAALRWRPRSVRDVMRVYHAWRWHARERAWAEHAAARAASLVDPAFHQAVITSGPPHGTHLAGSRIAQEHGLAHVVDMRDPWSQQEQVLEHLASPLYFTIARRRERRVVRRAALLVANTELARRSLSEAHPDAAARTLVVMNGFDDEPVQHEPSDRFTLVYAGSIYLDRDPGVLFRAAALVIEELGLTPAQFGIDFYGHAATYNRIALPDIAARAGVGAYVHVRPGVPRRELLGILAQATMLVSLPQGTISAIPSKVFEYMPYHAWLLALADPESSTAQLLADTRADVVGPADLEGLTAVLRTRVLEHRAGVVPTPVAEERFSRRSQARALIDALDGVVGAPRR